MSTEATKPTFTLSSADIKEGEPIAAIHTFNGFGCSGENLSPALKWSGAPPETKSFALTCYDPDAPTGSGFWHWVVFNIPPNVTELPRGAGSPGSAAAPKSAVQSRTDFGATGYGGPCPPKGDTPHRYQFTIFAVDTDMIEADAQASGALVGFNLHFHTLAKTTLTALFGH
ncbi:MAG: YbhB/YbcL family Raf kinase inhibitor-like protein [Bradyrhizobium sp.]|nr:MAG: YbhB/YbcL family Raf kinase inhibitor-like protein [Bradyrhizobium sp.]